MEKTKPLVIITFITFFLVPLFFAQAQTGDLVQNLFQEYEKIQKQLQDKELEAKTKRALWLTLARLQLQSGDYQGAAASYSEAAFSVPASRDEDALLRASLCYLYVGEFDRASSTVKNLLLTSRNSQVIERAQLIGAVIDAFRGESGALQNLELMLQDPARGAQKPALLYILYHLTGKEAYVQGLKKEWGNSAEAALLEGPSATLKLSPLWLIGTLEPQPSQVQNLAAEPKEMQQKKDIAPQEEILLQLGLFNQQGNAQQMASRLQEKGFKAEIRKRTVNGSEYWAVTVIGGVNYNQKLMELKNAGFEAFPVFPEK